MLPAAVNQEDTIICAGYEAGGQDACQVTGWHDYKPNSASGHLGF